MSGKHWTAVSGVPSVAFALVLGLGLLAASSGPALADEAGPAADVAPSTTAPAIDAGGTAPVGDTPANGGSRGLLLSGVNDHFRILLWLGLSASLSWAITLVLYRRWFGPARASTTSPVTAGAGPEPITRPVEPAAMSSRHLTVRRLIGRLTEAVRRRLPAPAATEATPTSEGTAAIPRAAAAAATPATPAPSASAAELARAATVLADAARQIAGQIERLEFLTEQAAASTVDRTPGLFEPAPGEMPGEDPFASVEDDELADVEPVGLLDLASARELRASQPEPAAPATGRPAATLEKGDRLDVQVDELVMPEPEIRFEFHEDGRPDLDFGAADMSLEEDDLIADAGLDAFELEELSRLTWTDGAGDLTGASDDVPEPTPGPPPTAARGPAQLPSRAARRPRPIPSPSHSYRPLGIGEISELVALGLGDGELLGGDDA